MSLRPAVERAPGADLTSDLLTLLELVRTGAARTRTELSTATGLGRTAVTQRVTQLIEAGLLEEGELNASTGGRQARTLKFRKDSGRILVAELGATSFSAGVTDLCGNLLAHHSEPCNIAAGPEPVLERVEARFDTLLKSTGSAPVWGIGVGLPGPVEFATGQPSEPPIMPGWDGYPVRDRLARRYDAPVWVDNEVNLMALGALREDGSAVRGDLLYLKVGTGIGAGITTAGRLHRGAQGCAGDIGHVAVLDDSPVVCRCGKTGCLESLAGGAALARDGKAAAEAGTSPYLRETLAASGTVTSKDVAAAAQAGDRTAVELLITAGQRIGALLATLVNFYNPSTILLGGGVAGAGDLFLATIRETIYRRSLPLATRDLQIRRANAGDLGGLAGASLMVCEELFSMPAFCRWLPRRTPAGYPELPDESRT
ncbi:ROK family protein [Streptomyces purpurogeneiscleroticus]|uniref:ROK family protein n=1 Tax=Streptomyces purpurogeneiscleroticus TaxID=68259 RepID=UPI001CBAA9C2|nr:ROK family protein [Streptomyces purpurogeneiscleroticus]MBZ4017654.1 sugar kinase [Streptomyces purpurogeneiscleroticus]